MTELSSVAKVILGALQLGPRTGYGIKRMVDRSTRFFWAASYGQIYPELRRLEETGLVESASEPRGGRPRRVHRLTPAGRAALRDWLRSDASTHEVRDEGLLKLFFASALPPSEAVELVRAKERGHRRMLERLGVIEAGVPRRDGRVDFPRLCLEYGIGLNEWAAEWCARAAERIEANARKEARK
jgi:PadR family transcriptional regulator, regulatory protein AphA